MNNDGIGFDYYNMGQGYNIAQTYNNIYPEYQGQIDYNPPVDELADLWSQFLVKKGLKSPPSPALGGLTYNNSYTTNSSTTFNSGYFPTNPLNQIVGVQPMSIPNGLTYYLNYKYENPPKETLQGLWQKFLDKKEREKCVETLVKNEQVWFNKHKNDSIDYNTTLPSSIVGFQNFMLPLIRASFPYCTRVKDEFAALWQDFLNKKKMEKRLELE